MKLLRREEPTAVLARRYGVSEQSLYRWQDEFLEAGQAALADGKNGSGDGHSKRLQELQRAGFAAKRSAPPAPIAGERDSGWIHVLCRFASRDC